LDVRFMMSALFTVMGIISPASEADTAFIEKME
jgi:hypothetical protein